MTQQLVIEGIYSKVVNFAMQQNHVPILRKLILKNTGETSLTNLKVVLSGEPAFVYEWTTGVDVIGAGQSMELDGIGMKLSADYLFGLTERILGTLHIRVTSGDAVLAQTVHELEVLAYDEWSGSLYMPEMVAAFVTPNHPKIAEIIVKAGKILEKWTGSPAFTGYQSKNPNTVRLQIAAIYGALQGENIAYSLPPASFEAVGQRVRLCDTVLETKIGTCLDLSLLYAGALEAAGIHPLLIFTKGHAFAGGWLEDECFAEAIQDDVSLITKRVAEGINEICLVECTAYTAGGHNSFDEAVVLAERHVADADEFEYLVDIKRTRGGGIRPIPMKIKNEAGDWVMADISPLRAQTDVAVNLPRNLETYDKLKPADRIAVTKQQIWERKLLDLSLRNTLVSFRVTQNAIQLMAGDLGELEDALSSGLEFQIMAKPKDWENELRDSKIYETQNRETMLETIAKTEFANKRIRTFIDENEVTLRVTSLYRQAKTRLEENGSNTLYLALGFLRWYESEVSEKARYAPLVLLPIDIIRKSAQKGYVIRIRDEEPQMNITLLEMLRQDFGLTIGGLDPLPGDESGVDLKRVFNIIRQAVMDKPRWDVDALAFIGLFSFSQFVMWNDIRNRADDLKRNRVVASLMSGKMEWVPESDFPKPDSLDTSFIPSDLAVPISADSSQLSAVCAAGKGNSFVLHGPPGTGKSQTITNIIANALFQGKSVLFIAEKMAALSVVQKRLAAIGLGDFCLELHSNKAKKKDVLAQLEQVLGIGRKGSPADYGAEAERLYGLRMKLNEIVEAVHKERPAGFSLYEALVRFESFEGAPGVVSFADEEVLTLTPQKLTHWNDLVGELTIAGQACGGAQNHPLRAMHRVTYSQTLKDSLKDKLIRYQSGLNRIRTGLLDVENALGLGHLTIYGKQLALMEFLKILLAREIFPAKLFASRELPQLKDRLVQICSLGRERDALENTLKQAFEDRFLELDGQDLLDQWREAEGQWFLAKMLGEGKLKKTIKLLAKNPESLTKESIQSAMEQLVAYQQLKAQVTENGDIFSELYGLLWSNGRPDWSVLEAAYEDAVIADRLLAILCELPGQRQAILLDPPGLKIRHQGLMAQFIQNFDEVMMLETGVKADTGIDFDAYRRLPDWMGAVDTATTGWLNNLEGLRSWSTYLVSRSKAEASGLKPVLDAYEQGLLKEDRLTDAFSRGLYLAVARQIVGTEACLTNFSGAILEGEIEKYKQTCARFETLTREELVARLSAKIPPVSANVADSSEIGLLLKAIRSGGRMLSIRRLFDSIPNLLRRLCPCMLMSPISVAQYIDPKYPPFDLVVFDEASQLPTSEAVGAIARGEHVIVVGDPKQLPPTSFFSTDRTDEDNFEVEDLESILDDCMAISMPQTHLLWHYRSKHESLIAFSNRQYYGNKLFTFPSPNDLVSKVTYVPVGGYYDRGRTKQNRAEAEAVVAEILRRLQSMDYKGQSMGVVTFSSVQQNLVDDLLIEAFAKNPAVEALANALYEPIFVKNLENVQGDERDVILFSVGYGPDETGRVALNFGPLNRDGGWRRLNVAVSRARREMVVYSTLKPEQIDLSKTGSEGVAGLKAFLEYAQKGRSALPTHLSQSKAEKDKAEKQIAQKIRSLGYEVNTHIGSSEYKIDIGIVHPHVAGTYILGIMCDGNNYKSASTARDRNILQEGVLGGLGWQLYRLWTLDWWEDREQELKKIQAAVLAALEREKQAPVAETIKTAQAAPAAKADEAGPYATGIKAAGIQPAEINPAEAAIEKYTLSRLKTAGGGSEAFLMPKNQRFIVAQIGEILKMEAPVSRNLLLKRLLAAWGIARMGSRIDQHLETLLGIGKVVRNQGNGQEFYWKPGQNPENYKAFRVPQDEESRRSLEDIPPQEVVAAIDYILKNQLSLSITDLVREVYKLFGFARGGAAMEACVLEGLRLASEQGRVTVDEATGRVSENDEN